VVTAPGPSRTRTIPWRGILLSAWRRPHPCLAPASLLPGAGLISTWRRP